MNDRQKRIIYKNVGILFALTVLCAVLARRISYGGGETLQDIAERQEQQQAAESEDTSPTGSLPVEEQALSEADTALSADSQPAEKQENLEDSAALPESEKSSLHSEGEPAMEDRVTYEDGFYYESLSDTLKERISGISYPADDSNAAVSYDTLRYVCVRYYDFNDEAQSGELICHKAIARDLVEIFYELYEAHYPIEKITLVDDYQGDDESSMQDNNTSCFNYRALPSGKLSNHAYGLAVDLNPFYNPYVVGHDDGSVSISPTGSEDYADRDQSFAYKIDKNDLAYTLFIQHGFSWGGSWRSCKDYQHFEKEI